MSQLSFENLFSNFKIDENNSRVKRRRKSFADGLSYLNDYQVWLGNETVLDIFDRNEIIGSGGGGQVFKVSDNNGNSYAFKRIQLKGIEKIDVKTLREVIAWKKLSHANVVKFYEYWIDLDDYTHGINLFIELCKENLLQWFQREKHRDYFKCLEMFLQICQGLRHIHSKKIIHRDLNPKNILISFNGVCKITDFGLSTFHVRREENSVTHTEQSHTLRIGTPLYAAPEQWYANYELELNHNERYNYKVDIFSLGLICMQLMIQFDDEEQTLKAIQNLNKNNLLPEIFSSHFIEEGKLIKIMTDHDPHKRPDIEQVLSTFVFISKYREAFRREEFGKKQNLDEESFISGNIAKIESMNQDHDFFDILSSTTATGNRPFSGAVNFGSLQESSPNPLKQFLASISDSPLNSPTSNESDVRTPFDVPIPKREALDIDGDECCRISHLFEGKYCLDEVVEKSFARIETFLKKGTSHFHLLQIMKDEYSKLSKHMDRVESFYHLLTMLIEYGVHVTECVDHIPQCPPKANCDLLIMISQSVLKPFISWANNRNQLGVEVELLEGLEKFIYEKGQYRVATGDIMDILFKCGVSAAAFGQWSSSLDTCDGIRKRLLVNQIINQGFLLVRNPK